MLPGQMGPLFWLCRHRTTGWVLCSNATVLELEDGLLRFPGAWVRFPRGYIQQRTGLQVTFPVWGGKHTAGSQDDKTPVCRANQTDLYAKLFGQTGSPACLQMGRAAGQTLCSSAARSSYFLYAWPGFLTKQGKELHSQVLGCPKSSFG